MLAGNHHQTNKATRHVHLDVGWRRTRRRLGVFRCVSRCVTNRRRRRIAILVCTSEDDVSGLDQLRVSGGLVLVSGGSLFGGNSSRRRFVPCIFDDERGNSPTASVHLKLPTKIRVSLAWIRKVWPINDSRYWTAWFSFMLSVQSGVRTTGHASIGGNYGPA